MYGKSLQKSFLVAAVCALLTCVHIACVSPEKSPASSEGLTFSDKIWVRAELSKQLSHEAEGVFSKMFKCLIPPVPPRNVRLIEVDSLISPPPPIPHLNTKRNYELRIDWLDSVAEIAGSRDYVIIGMARAWGNGPWVAKETLFAKLKDITGTNGGHAMLVNFERQNTHLIGDLGDEYGDLLWASGIVLRHAPLAGALRRIMLAVDDDTRAKLWGEHLVALNNEQETFDKLWYARIVLSMMTAFDNLTDDVYGPLRDVCNGLNEMPGLNASTTCKHVLDWLDWLESSTVPDSDNSIVIAARACAPFSEPSTFHVAVATVRLARSKGTEVHQLTDEVISKCENAPYWASSAGKRSACKSCRTMIVEAVYDEVDILDQDTALKLLRAALSREEVVPADNPR